MELSSGTHIPDGLLAATALLNENPRLGFQASACILHPDFELANSLTAQWDSRSVAAELRWTHQTGRFMSPDIIGGDLSNPQSLNRYAYVLNNPLSYTDFMGFQAQVCTGTTSNGGEDPTACGGAPGVDEQGFAAANQGPAPDVGGGSAPMALPDLSGNGNDYAALTSSLGGWVSGGSSFSGGSSAQGALDMAGMIPGPIGIGANLASAGISAYNGHYGAAALSLAFATPFIGQFGEEGYRTFSAFKSAEGLAAEGMQWHHIVEQTPGNLARFGPGAIHNVENLVQVPRDLHIGKGSISAYYSGKDVFTGGQTVRQWLAPQSFEAQRDFGLEILRGYGLIP